MFISARSTWRVTISIVPDTGNWSPSFLFFFSQKVVQTLSFVICTWKLLVKPIWGHSRSQYFSHKVNLNCPLENHKMRISKCWLNSKTVAQNVGKYLWKQNFTGKPSPTFLLCYISRGSLSWLLKRDCTA